MEFTKTPELLYLKLTIKICFWEEFLLQNSNVLIVAQEY